MARKFEVEVIRTDKYIITIDEDNIDDGLIEDYECIMHSLGEDKIKQLAEEIGTMATDNDNEFYEGIGFIGRDGLNFGHEEVKGINIETILVDDYETNTTEINS